MPVEIDFHLLQEARMLVRIAFGITALAVCVFVAEARADDRLPKGAADTLRQVAGILDYIGGDYRGAVGPDGAVRNPSEYAEQRALANDAAALASQAGLAESDPVRATLKELGQALGDKRPPEAVERLCRRARELIVTQHGVDLAPSSVPTRAAAEQLYKSQGCNTCHGDDGGAHTPTAAALDPKPANFLDPERVATVSAHRAFHAITFGVPSTAMRAFTQLSDAQRWSLAFYVLALRHMADDVAAGKRAFERDKPAAPADARGLSSLSEEELTAKLASIADPRERSAVLAYLRVEAPFAHAQDGGMARAYQQLDAGLLAYRRGDREGARRLFISAYLDGVEPHEAALRARDAELTDQIEHAMLDLRTVAAQGVSEPQLAAAVARARSLLDRAHGTRADATAALVGALTITLREGVEIVLLIAALLGLVRKRGQPQLSRYVHAGWLLAIPAGLLTFMGAESLLSGMQRELAEGIASLLAALVLLGMTHWLLGQLGAKRWVGFLASRVGAVTGSQRAALGVLGLSFLAAYREAFEIVLFFQALLRDAEGATREVWLGAALGLALLCVVALLLLRVGKRLQPAPFMLASSIFLAVLSFMLVGKGVHSLQEAAVLPIHHVALPELPLLGVFATCEGLLVQGAVLVLLLLSALWPLRAARRRAAGHASPAE
jgi:high-affinity iron transporter